MSPDWPSGARRNAAPQPSVAHRAFFSAHRCLPTRLFHVRTHARTHQTIMSKQVFSSKRVAAAAELEALATTGLLFSSPAAAAGTEEATRHRRFHDAIVASDLGAVRVLLDKEPGLINRPAESEWAETPLHVGALLSSPSVVRELLEFGASAKDEGAVGSSALEWASILRPDDDDQQQREIEVVFAKRAARYLDCAHPRDLEYLSRSSIAGPLLEAAKNEI